MQRTKKNPNLSSADNIHQFRQSFLSALNKLNDAATKKLGLDEIHSILSQQAQSPEYISLILHLLSENDDHQKVGARRETLKVLGIMAEVFENRILEFLPKILALVTKKLKENNPQIHDSLSDAMGSVVGFGLRRLPSRDACQFINSTLRTLYGLCEGGNKYTQIGAAMCIYKIIQCSPVECLYILTDELSDKLAEILQMPGCKAHLQLFECILSLVLGIEDNLGKLKSSSRILFPVVIENLSNLDWNVRKIAVDVVYTLSVLLKEAIVPRKQELLNALSNCKFDKIRNVRDITATTIAFLKSLPDAPTGDSEEASVSPLLQKKSNEDLSKSKEGVVYVSFGKSDPTLKTMLEKPQIPGGDFESVKPEESSQHRPGTKQKNGREKNPNFFNNPKNDVEVFSKGGRNDGRDLLQSSKNESHKSQDLVHKESYTSTKKIDKSPHHDKHPVVTDFLDENNGYRAASAQKKPRTSDEIMQNHRRQVSENENYTSNTKFSQGKADLLSKKRDSLEANYKNYGSGEIVETPARGEASSGIRLPNPDSGTMSSPQILADDFANLSKQLKKITKQQSQLIESVSSFQTTTQAEIALLKNRLGTLEDFVQKIYQTQKETSMVNHYVPHPQYTPTPGYPYPFQQSYNGGFSQQYSPGAFRDAYSGNPAQSMDLQDQILRQSYQVHSYQSQDEYHHASQGGYPHRSHYQNFNPELAESGPVKFKDERKQPPLENKERHFEPKKREQVDSSTDFRKETNENQSRNAWTTKTRKSSTWSKVEEMLKKGQIGEAYAVCVSQGDEGEVIRLMKETGVVVHKLNELVVEEVLGVVEKRISESGDRNLILEWIEKGIQMKAITDINLLMRLHETLGQVLGESTLKTEEYQRVGKLKGDIGNLVSREEGNSETEAQDRYKKRV